MPFTQDLPAENTDPWYTQITQTWGALKTFVNDLETSLGGKVDTADRAGLSTAGWAEAIVIPNGGTVPTGLDPYTLVIEEE